MPLAVRLARIWKPLIALMALVGVATTLWIGGFGAHAAPTRYPGRAIQLAPADMEALIFVWASGTPAIQRVAQTTCVRAALSSRQCAAIGAAVRHGWLDLMARDPAALGHVGVAPNPRGRADALGELGARLTAITGARSGALLPVTRQAYAQITSPAWIQSAVAPPSGNVRAPLPRGIVLVWATSFSQSPLPNGLNPTTSAYVALPDAYLKFANWGQITSIPAIYQPYYAPSGTQTHWSVSVMTPDLTHRDLNVLVTDVGPWNEDDNWWDPDSTSATLPASCPVATTTRPGATANRLVNGICPNGRNLRRVYYYLLYQHGGLPFFQASAYAPSGGFNDTTAWPTDLNRYCSEASAASFNSDNLACTPGTGTYNQTNGAWDRSGLYDQSVSNQASIDLSPAVDKALGWTYPASGLVQVVVGTLP